ncbi:gliding motility lipoprotein GldB [Phaeocystidibacter luteus]|uniref:Gliding motility lipoprotein GldB n=1 Tax=Phaeocystidibacter luteus TaxID=911197 RepID=A0A6N6RJ94_9FLAO|nr:hypothetical protein [Phaeocystidibacter luteus]KAB2813668.1 hypothetical protein F8C67_05765 [Phaeocystidibacter luteus]
MRNSIRFILLFSAALLIGGCSEDRWDVDVSKVPQETTFHAFAEMYYENDSATFFARLPQMVEEYPHFFRGSDSMIWVDQRFDRQLNQLWQDSKIAFTAGVEASVKSEIENGFKHYYYHFPEAESHDVYTYLSNLQFDFPVLYVDSLNSVFIAKDTYLGSDHPAYVNIPSYISRRLNPSHIAADVFEEIAKSHMAQPSEEGLIEDMVQMGIVRYFQTAVLRNTPHEVIFGYTPEQLAFCREYELNIWRYFVEGMMLFESDIDLKRRFVMEAPFSKFYTDIDNQTPGRIAEWIGWNIVDSYMRKHDDVTLQELLSTSDFRKLFRDSNYKP